MDKQVDIQAECIGTLALYPKLYQHCVLRPEYFISGYREIYEAMTQCYKEHGEVIVPEMIKYNGFDVDLYMKCADTGMIDSVKRFNRIQSLVIGAYKERQIAKLTDDLNNHAITLEEYDKAYRSIIDLGIAETSKITQEELLNACIDDKKNIFFHRFRKTGALLKLKENDFMIIAGVTGSGKSGFALNLLEDLSTDYKCLYFNLEMVEQELLQRLISLKSNLLQNDVSRFNKLSQSDQNKATSAINDYAERNIHIISKSQTLDTLRANIAMNNSKEHMIVIIDHIGLIGTRARNSYERMTEIAKELRKYSLDFNCTIIGLCQLNREATKSNDGPKLSMLRDSGEIEQSASKALFVWSDDDGYSLVLLKNRSGRSGIVDIDYNKETQRIEERI